MKARLRRMRMRWKCLGRIGGGGIVVPGGGGGFNEEEKEKEKDLHYDE